MARVKSLLIGAEIVEAGRLRKCYHNKNHKIHKGERCLEVKEGLALKGYCLACAREMLAQANRRIDEIHASIHSG
jgi:hypothetical protein